MDDFDRRILEELRSDGRASLEEIGRRVSLSRPAVHERVKRLVEKGTIRGFGARIDWESIGWPVISFVQVRVHGGHSTAIYTAMSDPIQSANFIVEECHRVAGEWCLMAKIRAANLLGVQEFGDWVRSKPGVTAVTSTIVLSTIVDHGAKVMSVNGNGHYLAGRN